MHVFPVLLGAAIVLTVSFLADRGKTVVGIRKGIGMFIGILSSLLNVLILVSVTLAILPESTLTRWLGKDSGSTGFLIAGLLGSVSLIPGFISYPLSAMKPMVSVVVPRQAESRSIVAKTDLVIVAVQSVIPR